MTAAAAAKKETFNWEWMKWFEEHDRQTIQATELDKLRNYLEKEDEFSREPLKPIANLDWGAWKGKIKDPKFVDELRADYCAKVDIANSKTGFDQFYTWSEEGKKEHVNEAINNAKSMGFSLDSKTREAWLAMTTEGFKAEESELMEAGHRQDGKGKQQKRELYLDYEQAEAEMDLFGWRGEMIELAEHPQNAEEWEESLAGRQTYTDKLLHEHEFHKFHKRERLAQQRDEKERQIFLERYKQTIKIHGHRGMESW